MLPTPDNENSQDGFRYGGSTSNDMEGDTTAPGSVTVPGDPFWSATPYDTHQQANAEANLNARTPNTFGFGFDSREAPSPWNLFPGSELMAGVAPVQTAGHIDVHDSVDIASPFTFGQNQGMVVDSSGTSEAAANNEPHIIYYINHVIPSTFPFLGPQLRDAVRNKILNSDASNSLIRSSTLAHCLALQKLGLERVGLDTNEQHAADQQRCEAIQETRSALRRISEDQSQTVVPSDADIAWSVLQLLLLQASSGETTAIKRLSADQVQIRRGFPDHDNLAALMETIGSRRRSSTNYPDDSVGDFAFSFIVITDILWSASMRRMPVLCKTPDDIAYFMSAGLDMHLISGCEAWVFENIAKINLLRIWKHACIASQSLNIVEMVKRAAVLEDRIQYHSAGTGLRLQMRTISRHVMLVTNVYAAAVRAYLHVVVSGAYTEVSDVRHAVDSCVNALKALSHASLVRRLAWPMCVAASLSDSRHDVFFSQIESGAQREQDECASVLRALQVARECKGLRQSSSKAAATFDWMDAMDSFGHEWILF